MHVDHDGGSDVEIRVDLRGLTEFAEVIRDEVERSVRPEAGVLLGVYAEGVCFGDGWWPSLDVRQAQERYVTCLAGVQDLLDAHVRAAERMAVAAEAVAKAYGSTDALAAATADDIDRAFMEARTKLDPPGAGVPGATGDVPGAAGGARGAAVAGAGSVDSRSSVLGDWEYSL